MNSKHRILMVSPFYPPDIGGIANHVQNISKNLSKQGNLVSIIAPRIPDSTEFSSDDGMEITRIRTVSLPGWPYPTLNSFRIPVDLGSKINSVIKKGDFDIIHVHGHHYPTSWISIDSAHKNKISSVLTLHGRYALNPKVIEGKTKVEEIFNKIYLKRKLAKASGIVGLTNKITNFAKKYGVKESKYFTIPNGVYTEKFKDGINKKNDFREIYHINKNNLVILFRGRFEHVKGILEFAKAAKNLTENNSVEFVIVGGGKLESSLKSIIQGVEGIHLLGWQPIEKIHELYIASDIFVLPSRFEALPITVIEAMNAGIHIVYSPVGGVPEILEQYKPKTILDNISTESIQRVLSRLILNFSIDDVSSSLSYAQQFDWKNIAAKTNEAYSEILSN